MSSSTPVPPSEFQPSYTPSSFSMSPFEFHGPVPLVANLGPFLGWASNVPTLPFAPQRLNVEPHQYQPHHLTVDYIPVPSQDFLNQIIATEQVAPPASPDAANSQFAPPHKRRVENMTAGGPIRRSTRRQEKKPYARRSTSTSPSQATSQSSSPASECLSLPTVQRRLAVQGVCKIEGCGQTFTSAKVYQDHVQIFHDIKKGKHGSQISPCPWDGCTAWKTEASLWNHVLGHNMKRACSMCDKKFKGDRPDSVHRHMERCKGRSSDSNEKSDGYVYFDEES